MGVKFSFDNGNSSKPQEKTGVEDNGYVLPGTNGCALILIHGLTGTPHEMRFLANYLNRQGYAIYCPRLANHGESIHILKRTTWQECYQTVRACYLEIRGQYKHVYTSGLSMGALLALLLADEFKGEISGISCLSPTLFYDGWNTPWYSFLLPLGYFTPLRHFTYFKEEPPYGFKSEAMRRRIHEYYEGADLHNLDGVSQYGYPYFPLSLLYQLEKLVRYLNRRLHNIDAPVQLIQAQEDDMTSVKNSQFIYDRVASNKKELVLLQNSYHIITADQERNTVAQKMMEFFNAQSFSPVQ
jgi:carboxylesterase